MRTSIAGFARVEVDHNPMTAAHPFYAYVSYENKLRMADIHQAFEFGVLLKGKKEMHFEGVTLKLLPGDVWLSPGYEVHGWDFLLSDAVEVWVQFLPQFLAAQGPALVPWLRMFAAPPAMRPSARSAETRRQVLAIASDLAAEVEQRRDLWQEGVKLALLRMLLVLYREWDARDIPDLPQDSVQNRLEQIMPALELIYSDSSRRVALADAAAACALEPSYFGQVFRQTMGVTFSRFALRARLAYAAELLVSGRSPISATAEETGFVDASHFHRRFAEVYGCTPRGYRRRHLAQA